MPGALKQNVTLPTRAILGISLGLTLFLVVLYVVTPSFVLFVNYKIMDSILASNAVRAYPSGDVAVVDIDEKSLATHGQWPWPRYRLAALLEKIQHLGAASVGLTFILAEPDRTSPKAWQEAISRDLGYQVDIEEIPPDLRDHDLTLAHRLTGGPFVLGYTFLFEKKESIPSCRLHPLKVVWIRKGKENQPPQPFFEAQGVVCNLGRFSNAVSRSGFLNASPDVDGILRRIPLLIRYDGQIYPSLALASVLEASGADTIQIRRKEEAPDYVVLGEKAIPVDKKGCLCVPFSAIRHEGSRVSAGDVLEGKTARDILKNKIVFVGTSASGLAQSYPSPGDPLFPQVEVHAQTAEAILAGNFVSRNRSVLLWEVSGAVLLAVLYCLCLVRLGVWWNLLIGGAFIFGSWQCAYFVYGHEGVLISPLLPAIVVVMNFTVITVYTSLKGRSRADEKANEAFVLMKTSEDQLDAIVKAIPDIVFRLDAAGNITFLSPAVTKYNTTQGDLMGRPILDLVAPEDRKDATYRINERRTGARATSGLELRLLFTKHFSGRDNARYFSVSAEGIYSGETPSTRTFEGTQGIASDITERKMLEGQLVRSQQMEAVGNLAAGVAHDLNNILSGLVSYPELLLLDLPEDSPLRKPVKIIQRSGQRAAAIVQDLLALSRRSVAVDEILDLNDVVKEYLSSPEYYKLRQRHPKMRLETDLSPDLLPVKGSPAHLSKLIMNVVSNAAEAMPAGGGMRLHTRNQYLDAVRHAYDVIPEGEYVMLRVKDEGIGIPMDDINRIFEPFYTKKALGASGTGLGMTVIWATVKDHHGYLDVHSQEGQGTRFDIYLPACRETATVKKQRVVLQDYIGSERILVVDDVPEQREIAVNMLGKLGYQVDAVPSGEAAVSYMQQNQADLLVLDMIMEPGMDGLETYRRIIALHPGQKAIIASGFSESKRVKRLQELGAGAYIRKPYTLEKIGMAVRTELDRK